MTALLEAHLLNPGRANSLKQCHIKKVRNWCFRFEFQDRGTIQVHMILWADLLGDTDPLHLSGQTDDDPWKSPFVEFLNEVFKCRVDVQVGDGSRCLLRYVSG